MIKYLLFIAIALLSLIKYFFIFLVIGFIVMLFQPLFHKEPPDLYINKDFFIRVYDLDSKIYALYHTSIKDKSIDDDLVVTGIFKNRIYNIAWDKEYIYGQTYDDMQHGTITRVSISNSELIEYKLPYSYISKNNLMLKPLAEAYEELELISGS